MVQALDNNEAGGGDGGGFFDNTAFSLAGLGMLGGAGSGDAWGVIDGAAAAAAAAGAAAGDGGGGGARIAEETARQALHRRNAERNARNVEDVGQPGGWRLKEERKAMRSQHWAQRTEELRGRREAGAYNRPLFGSTSGLSVG
jgi:hypothetical protein